MPLGSKSLTTPNNLSNTMAFAIRRSLVKINTLMLCKITGINNQGTGNETLSVQPLVNNVSAENKAIVPPISYEVPQTRIMGGNAGIIIQYQVGDTCLVGYCNRDISSAKRTGQLSNADTGRILDLADAVVIAHWSNTLPNIYIKITNDIIDIKRNNAEITLNDSETLVKYGSKTITINDTDIEIQGNLKVNGTIESTGDIKAPDLLSSTTPGLTAFTHVHALDVPHNLTLTPQP